MNRNANRTAGYGRGLSRAMVGVGAVPALGGLSRSPVTETEMMLSLRAKTRAQIDAYRAEGAAKARAKEAARAEWLEFFRSQIENVEIT